MQIRLAEEKDSKMLSKYDGHIRQSRLEGCIRDGLVYVLVDGETILGILRYSLFWQSIPFLGRRQKSGRLFLRDALYPGG